MPWTRVRDKRTGHHYSTAVVDPEHHQVLKQDAVDRNGRPLPAKPNVSASRSSAKSEPTAADEKGN